MHADRIQLHAYLYSCKLKARAYSYLLTYCPQKLGLSCSELDSSMIESSLNTEKLIDIAICFGSTPCNGACHIHSLASFI